MSLCAAQKARTGLNSTSTFLLSLSSVTVSVRKPLGDSPLIIAVGVAKAVDEDTFFIAGHAVKADKDDEPEK